MPNARLRSGGHFSFSSITTPTWVRPTLLALALLAFSPLPATAQLVEFMEWLDRLSGPGPFQQDPGWFPSIRVPLACVTEVTTFEASLAEIQKIIDQPGATDDQIEQKVGPLVGSPRLDFGLAPKCLGALALFRAGDNRNPPWGLLDNRPIVRKRNVLGVELRASHLASERNDLEGYPRDLSDAQKQVKLFIYGLGVRYLPHDAAHIFVGWDRYHFYSPSGLFDSFNRDTRTLELGVKPLWRATARAGFLKPLTLATGLVYGLGPFVARDFGARGSFEADDDRTAFVSIGYDIWWHGCWIKKCREGGINP